MNGNRYLPILNPWLSGLITEENYKAPSEYMVDCKQLTQYLINENAHVDSTSFKDLEHVRIKADQKYHGI
ncbi:hypothetical protein [Leuconostoc mesenteroides]|uniref:hypothetical protein n=1 Tax=Leuconostoc mesenteroides TaxID=1245 RepID=UPI0023625EDD|nr:hypothetical protein [Leuconostoc mesenteroides]